MTYIHTFIHTYMYRTCVHVHVHVCMSCHVCHITLHITFMLLVGYCSTNHQPPLHHQPPPLLQKTNHGTGTPCDVKKWSKWSTYTIIQASVWRIVGLCTRHQITWCRLDPLSKTYKTTTKTSFNGKPYCHTKLLLCCGEQQYNASS